MRAFADLYRRLDSATSTRAKQAALIDAFAAARDDPSQWASAAWMVYFLAGGKPRQTVPTRLLWRLAVEGSGFPEWLCAECYSERRRSRRDAGAAAAGRRRRRGDFARRLDARAPASAAVARRGGKIRTPAPMGGSVARRPAARLLQAHHRRIARRRFAAAGRQGAGRGRRRRRKPDGAAHDRLRPGATHSAAGDFEALIVEVAHAEARRSTRAGPIPSIWRNPGSARSPTCRRRSALRATGSSNGSSTAFARNCSGAARAGAYGRAARSSFPTPIPISSRSRALCPRTSRSTANSSS